MKTFFDNTGVLRFSIALNISEHFRHFKHPKYAVNAQLETSKLIHQTCDFLKDSALFGTPLAIRYRTWSNI